MTKKIIFYYPKKHNAPSHVARSIFVELTNKDIYKSIILFFQKSSLSSELDIYEKQLKYTSVKELLFSKEKHIVHFTVNPNVYPNRKFILYMISLLKGHEIIINYHGDPREEFKLQLKSLNYICLFYILDFIFSPSIMKRSNYIIVNSYYMKKLLEKKYTLDNIIVIPNGINEYWFKDEDSSDNSTKILPENIPNIIEEKQKKVLKFIYHGRLAPEKGVNILLSGFKKYLTIVNSHSNSQLNHLTIVGDGPQRKKLERFCHDLDLDEHVSFLGKVSDSQLNNELQNANAAIYPSIYEPFSLAILEAFTKVKGPVVYSKNIGINDFVKKEGYDFITFEPTAQDICNKLLTVAEKQYSKSIPREQQAFAAKYTWKNVTEKYIDTYNKLIET